MRGRALLALVVVTSVIISVGGCRASSEGVVVAAGLPKASVANRDAGQEIVDSINDFGFELLASVCTDEVTNVTVSPVSVHAVLSMIAQGAIGETASQIQSVLRTREMSAEESGEAWTWLLNELDERSGKQELETANALWASEVLPFEQAFLDADRDYFGAQVTAVDFKTDDVAGLVNDWADDSTHGMIERVVEQVPSDSVLCLANAVYFEGKWVSRFDKDRTSPMDFTTADGKVVTAEMMWQDEDLPYFEDEMLVATRLDYKGGDSAFYILLPAEGVGLAEAMEHLGDGGFSEVREGLDASGRDEVTVGLPKLDNEFSVELGPALAGMGMPLAFSREVAEFGAMVEDDTPVFLDSFIHGTKVLVDEEGTKMAAISLGMMGAAEMSPAVCCDHPYLFAVVDEPSGVILFLGAVYDASE